jgi:ABC-2 type transport system ATP-binding protein
VRERIGYMPEERGLYPKMRVADQLEYFAVLHGAPHEQARAAARSWRDRLGLGDGVIARVEELSQGNQQRVQLAAALVHRPDLLIRDEPFAGLDPIATDLLTDVLREEAGRGVPVLFSSHQLELPALCGERSDGGVHAGELAARGAGLDRDRRSRGRRRQGRLNERRRRLRAARLGVRRSRSDCREYPDRERLVAPADLGERSHEVAASDDRDVP